jgi:hypothetical protein
MIKYSAIVSLVILLCINIAMRMLQHQLIYNPSHTLPNRIKAHANDMNVIKLQTKDGLTLMSWYKPAQKNQPTVLICHGNAGTIATRMTLARALMEAGFGVFLLEYRGYGGNTGKPTEQGFYQDAHTAYHFLRKQNIQNNDIILYGESLGTGVAIQLATKYKIAAVILQSPYTSLPALARYHYPWVLIRPTEQYDSLGRIKKIKAPLMILHGKADTLVPYQHGLQLFNAAHQPKIMVSFTHQGHHRLWESPKFMPKVIQFINEIKINEANTH